MAERRVIKYKTVKHFDVDEFDKGINELFKEGWELYGPPYGLMNINGAGIKYQALVRYEGRITSE